MAKKRFFTSDRKKALFYAQKDPFFCNVDRFRLIVENRFLARDHKKNILVSVMLTVFELWPINDFLRVITIKRRFCCNVSQEITKNVIFL